MFREPQNASLHHEGGGILLPTVAESECINWNQYIEWQTYRNKTRERAEDRPQAGFANCRSLSRWSSQSQATRLWDWGREKPTASWRSISVSQPWMARWSADTMQRRLPLPRTSSVWRTTSTNLPSCRIRHHNTDNPHCHIVYNRINNEGKLLSDRNDYRRNEQVTKTLKYK